MAERLDIEVRENGSSVVVRNINAIAQSADHATRGLYLFQRALYTIGITATVGSIIGIVDSLNLMENRLRLTTSSTLELQRVQTALIDTANRSNSSLQQTADIYNRMALSAKGLGLSTSDLLGVTETLNKASILSGANSQEAHAALIQLGQGIASNRLGGDELRSILEQLPYVADIIANHLGVSRGELRKLGTEGKLTAKVIIDAFKAAKGEVDGLFAGTNVTIGQSLVVAGNEILRVIDRLDDASGFSAKIAAGIMAIGSAMGTIIPVALTLSSALIGIFAQGLINNINRAIASQTAYYASIRAGDTVMLGSATAAQMKATFLMEVAAAEGYVAAAALTSAEATTAGVAATLAAAEATTANAAARVADIQATRAQLATNLQSIQVQRIQAANYLALQQGIAVATGRTGQLAAAQTAMNDTTKALIATRRALAATDTQLVAAEGAVTAAMVEQSAALTALQAATAKQTVASAALSAADVQLAAASAAAAGSTGIFAGAITALSLRFPGLAAAVVATGGAIRTFAAFLATNWLTVLIVGLSALYFSFTSAKSSAELLNESITSTESYMSRLAAATDETTGKIDLAAKSLQGLSLIQLKNDTIDAYVARAKAFDELAAAAIKAGDAANLANSGFSVVAQQGLMALTAGLVNGTIPLGDFNRRLEELAKQTGDTKFDLYVRGLSESSTAAIAATENTTLLTNASLILSGALPALASYLGGAAGAAYDLAAAANTAAGAIDALVAKIPAMAKAAKMRADLSAAGAELTKGEKAYKAQLDAGDLTLQEYSGRMQNLNTIYKTATSEIDGTAEATRDATKAQADYSRQAQLASLSGVDRTIQSATNSYNDHIAVLKKAGASQAELNQANNDYRTIVAGIRRDAAAGGSKGGSGGGAAQAAAFKADLGLLGETYKQIEAAKLSSTERRISIGLMKLEEEQKRALTGAERENAAAVLGQLEIAKNMGQVLDGLRQPQENVANRIAAIDQLMKEGKISAEEYAQAMLKVAASTDAVGNSFKGGIKSGLAQVAAQSMDLGRNVAQWVVGSFDAAADAIVKFAQTGKIDIRALFGEIFANLLKLMTNQIFSQLIGGLLGGGGGGGGGGFLSGLLGALTGAASGGTIMPSGIGQSDTQPVMFKKRPDERVDILTPQQQKAQAMALEGANRTGGGTQVVEPKVNIQIVNEDDPGRAVSAMSSDAGTKVIMNAIRKNPDQIRTLLR